MSPWTVIPLVVAGLAGYGAIVHILGRVAGQTSRLEAELLANIVDHPTRNAKQVTQVHYAELIVWELAQHGHTVTIIDILDCLASTRVKFADDIDGAAVDAYYATVLGGNAS